MKKIISLLLAFSMVIALASCGGKPTTTEAEKQTQKETSKAEVTESPTESVEEKKEPVTITLYPADANLTSGRVGGWLGDYLLEHGIILDIWAYSDEKSNAIFASGELPDIMYIAKGSDFKVLSNSGYLLIWKSIWISCLMSRRARH